jgi:hypothetical protein
MGHPSLRARNTTLLSWFTSASRAAWKERDPTLIIVPFRTHAYAMKAWLLEHEISLFGTRFVVPAQLRELLAARIEKRLALREHLRLLLAATAEESMKLPDVAELREQRVLEPDFLAAKSVRRAPDHLLRTIHQVGAAGWDFSALSLPGFEDLVTRFQAQVSECGFELTHRADRGALERSQNNPPLFADVLVSGFNGADWPLWPLLQAAVLSARSATVLLDEPADVARDIDEAWIGTWEEAFGEAKPIAASPTVVGDTLFTEAEMKGVTMPGIQRSFLVGADTTEQAEAITELCLHFLSDRDVSRIGIIFSGAGALPRLVTNALVRAQIPHHDALGHFSPGEFETAEWRAWLELQGNPRIDSLLQFLNSLPARERVFPDVDFVRLEQSVRSAYAEVLIDDLDILQHFFRQQVGDKAKAAATVLNATCIVPASGCLQDFLHQTKIILARLGWKSRWADIARHVEDWAGQLRLEFPRVLYLRWLGEIASTFTPARNSEGDHPYARVQLLTVPQAQGQEFSHLIFAGWNEGSWPRREKGEFARQEDVDAFNHRIQRMNRRASRQGRHGEGHSVVRENHTIYLGPAEQKQIELRQFEALFDSARREVAFTASLVEDDTPERFWNPSESFTRHFQEASGQPLTQQAMNRLHAGTREWLFETRSSRIFDAPSAQLERTRVAYDARRDPNTRSGEYDFAFRSRPPVVPRLSVTEFERLISAPALVWLKQYLGVKAPEENASVWDTSSGKWVHDWLAAIAATADQTFTRWPGHSQMEERLFGAAETKRAAVTALCEAAGKSLPDWWTGGWRNAFFVARVLSEKLGAVIDWPWMATEWRLEGEFPVGTGQPAQISLRGRIDLLLAQQHLDAGSLSADDLWLIDYKTGAKKGLPRIVPNDENRRPQLKKRLLDGSALQLGLYALAAGALGAGKVEVSILSPVVRQLQPQISGAEFLSESDIFFALAKMQQTGVFGMHGPLRSAYRFTEDYPLATLAVDPDILEQRWELTHPALVRDEEEVFW